MRTIAHISDLHFGIEDARAAEALAADLHAHPPALTVVSGDLTQRARKSEFAAARQYLDRLPEPMLIVPGNHDVPLYDVFRRFLLPLRRYRAHITSELMPVFADEEILVVGVNTARSLTWKNGRISFAQIAEMKARLCAKEAPRFKMIVTHHPFVPPPGDRQGGVQLVGRAVHAMEVLDECGVQLLLAGHLHHGYTADVREYYAKANRSIIVAQAGTAISRRLRAEPNAYNRITVDADALTVAVRVCENGAFRETLRSTYKREHDQWRLVRALD